jgi:hypothetical protein
MKKVILCLIVLLLASPVYSEIYDLSEDHIPTRQEWLETKLYIIAYDIAINFSAAVTFFVYNDEILADIFLYHTDTWSQEKVLKLKERVLSDATFVLEEYYWSKDIPVTAKVVYPEDVVEKYEQK